MTVKPDLSNIGLNKTRNFFDASLCGYITTIKTETIYFVQFLASRLSYPTGRPAPCKRILLQKLTVSQIVHKFSVFRWIRRFITVFSRSRRLFLSQTIVNYFNNIFAIYASVFQVIFFRVPVWHANVSDRLRVKTPIYLHRIRRRSRTRFRFCRCVCVLAPSPRCESSGFRFAKFLSCSFASNSQLLQVDCTRVRPTAVVWCHRADMALWV